MSYCIDRPSLVLGLVPSDRMRAAPGGNRRTGLPVRSAERARCVGGVWGVEGDERASTKGAPRYRGAASWERLLRASTSVVEVCVERGWEASRGSSLLGAVTAAAVVACGR
jgi:hypothetical protein